MKASEQSHVFSSAARWIWSGPDACDAWLMFRRSVELPAGCQAACLRITASFNYLLYVNGTLVTRGPARSYDFCKAYDTVDVQPYLRPGATNVLAVLAPSAGAESPHTVPRVLGILAELSGQDAAGKPFAMATDHQWKVRRHDAFTRGTAGRSFSEGLLLGREEWFDARQELPGWTGQDFDDSAWAPAIELGPVGVAPWIKLEPSGIGLLSDDPILPVSFSAIELARLPRGYRFRLGSPPRLHTAIKIYATEITAIAAATVRLNIGHLVHLNGKRIVPDATTGTFTLPAGTSLLTVKQVGYFAIEMELLLETEAELSFSSQRIVPGPTGAWALYVFPDASVNYPWHETSDTIAQPAGLEEMLAAGNVDQIPVALRSGFVPVPVEPVSVYHDVWSQSFYHVRGGMIDPAIQQAQPRLPVDDALTSPLQNPQNLLHAHADAATLVPTPGYDAHFIVDFGRETIGYMELTVEAPAGTVIDTQGFELIKPGGIAWMWHNGFRYVCREGVQTFTSHIRRGFRYVSVTVRGFDRPVQFYALRCRRTVYPAAEIGGFECSDWRLNQAYRMSIDTAAVCMLDTYVDCPGHEQAFWVGDARITAQINQLAYGGYDLDQRCIRIVGRSLTPEWVKEYFPKDERYTSGKYLPIGAFPNYPEGGLPMWALLWGLQCGDHWQHGGNLTELRENYGKLTEMLRRCRLLTNERGLLDIPGAWNLIEWGTNDLSPYGEVTANNVLLVACLRDAAAMARALDLPEEAQTHAEEAEQRQAVINRLCWNGERQAYVDTVRDEWAYRQYQELCRKKGWQILPWEKYHGCLRVSEQTNTLAALCDCVPAERLDAVRKIIRRVERGNFSGGSPAGRTLGSPSEKEAPDGIVGIGSPFFLFFTLGALFHIGEGRLAFDVMRREWGKMADMGFRTCPETFGWPRSAAHAWSAAPAVYLPTRVLGIRALAPGFREFCVDPCPGDLEWARGSVATPYGPIHASWTRNADKQLEITCHAPPECRRIVALGKDKAPYHE
jgi:hypothetical protein